MYQSKFFKEDEFQSIGCSRCQINDDSLRRLDRAREIAGIPFILNSAFRSPAAELCKGRTGNSAHTRGRAFDVRALNARERYLVVFGAISAGFTRIGIGLKFVHMDDDPSLPGPVIWLY